MSDFRAFARWLARLPRDLARMALGRPPFPRVWIGVDPSNRASDATGYQFVRGSEVRMAALRRVSFRGRIILVDGTPTRVVPFSREIASAAAVNRIADAARSNPSDGYRCRDRGCPFCDHQEMEVPASSSDVGYRGYVPEWAERKVR